MAPNSELKGLLKKYFGHADFRPHQEEIIRSVMAGEDVFALLPTGGGKSLCFQLPAVTREGLTLVVSPLIALMKDQVDALRASGIPATLLNSSIDAEERKRRVKELDEGKYRLLYVAPERVILKDFLEGLERWKVNLFAIDEAHCISEWGHDFRPEYRRLPELRELLPRVPMLALTATATQRVRKDILQSLKLREPKEFVASFNRPNLTYRVAARQEAAEQVIRFIQERPGESGIVYCFSRKGSEEMAEDLKVGGIKALPYHAGLSAQERTKHQEMFLRDDVQVICATIAFGMGINKSNVRFVVHRDLPKNVESYYQETGRAGRDGLRSDCLLLYGREDVAKIQRFINQKPDEEERKHATEQVTMMLQYAESRECRRGFLLRYFGEEITGNCGSCDNCLREKYDSTMAAKKFLSCVFRIEQKNGGHPEAREVAEVLIGRSSEAVSKKRYTELSTFGIGPECDLQEWMGIGSEMVRQGYLRISPGKPGVLELTAEGKRFLTDKNSRIELTRVSAVPEPRTSDAPNPERTPESTEVRKRKRAERRARKEENLNAPYDRALFEQLRKLRKKLADERDVPPYVIFSDATLLEIARVYPLNQNDFSRITGVGEKKLGDFGELFTKEVRDFLEGNTRQDFLPNRGGNEFEVGVSGPGSRSVDLFMQGLSVEEVAKERGLTTGTIYRHLEEAIDSGVEIPRERFFSEAEWKEINSFYNDSNGPLKPLHDALKGKYSYDQLRIFRALAPARVRVI